MNEVAIVDELANQRIDLPQPELWSALEIATDKAIFVHSHLEGGGAGVFDCGGAELLGEREYA